jgi:AraC-like DNA-binding protein
MMQKGMDQKATPGLGRLCEVSTGGEVSRWKQPADVIIAAPTFPGIERIEARFFGDAFEPHRHDTYALGVTLQGVQTFHYRGEQRYSLPGNVIVLHPDEEHDGGAGTDAGLRYRMLYLEPSLLLAHLSRQHAALPFVADPVLLDDVLRAALLEGLRSLDDGLDELLVDDLLGNIAQGLARHAGRPQKPVGKMAWRQAHLARDFLAAHASRPVLSSELEQVTGLDRYDLSRQFRALFATSPHRFQIMRRLQHARQLIATGAPLAEVAISVGFTDQSHLNRHFKKAFGLTPGRWATLTAIKNGPDQNMS